MLGEENKEQGAGRTDQEVAAWRRGARRDSTMQAHKEGQEWFGGGGRGVRGGRMEGTLVWGAENKRSMLVGE